MRGDQKEISIRREDWPTGTAKLAGRGELQGPETRRGLSKWDIRTSSQVYDITLATGEPPILVQNFKQELEQSFWSMTQEARLIQTNRGKC